MGEPSAELYGTDQSLHVSSGVLVLPARVKTSTLVPLGVAARHDFAGIPDDLPERVRSMRQTGARVVKVAAMRLLPAVTLSPDGTDITPNVAGNGAVLVDAHDAIRRGGTGRTIDWQAVAPIAARRLVILAGGLEPGNVGEAIALARPAGVDVSSGVETAPGIKDPERMAAFVAAVRQVA